MDFDGAVQIFILSFSWQPNNEWKRTEKWFCLGLRVWGWGASEFMIFFFFYVVFMLNFLGLWIWFLRLWNLFAGDFVVDWKMRKSRFELRFCISGFCGLRKSEKICCQVYVCVLAGDWFVFVFGWQERARKCKKNVRKSRHVFLCLKSGFVFFGVQDEDEPRSGQLIFFLLLKLKNKYFKL